MKAATSSVLEPAGQGRGRDVARRNLDDKKQEKLLRKHCEDMILVILIFIQYNSSEALSTSNSDSDENTSPLRNQNAIGDFLFDRFGASFFFLK